MCTCVCLRVFVHWNCGCRCDCDRAFAQRTAASEHLQTHNINTSYSFKCCADDGDDDYCYYVFMTTRSYISLVHTG